jgi:hypothetical protein
VSVSVGKFRLRVDEVGDFFVGDVVFVAGRVTAGGSDDDVRDAAEAGDDRASDADQHRNGASHGEAPLLGLLHCEAFGYELSKYEAHKRHRDCDERYGRGPSVLTKRIEKRCNGFADRYCRSG